jgi:hypothetical protein
MAAIAPMRSRSHDARAFPALLFESGESSRDVEFEFAATAAVVTLDHDNDGLFNSMSFSQQLHKFMRQFPIYLHVEHLQPSSL